MCGLTLRETKYRDLSVLIKVTILRERVKHLTAIDKLKNMNLKYLTLSVLEEETWTCS